MERFKNIIKEYGAWMLLFALLILVPFGAWWTGTTSLPKGCRLSVPEDCAENQICRPWSEHYKTAALKYVAINACVDDTLFSE